MDAEILNSLKSKREMAGLTQKDVEQALELRNLAMRDYEIGRLKLPVTVAVQLSKLYKVSLDQLVGNQVFKKKENQSKVMMNFSALFLGNGFSVMFLDPILRAFLEDHYEKCFEYSLFELLTEDFSEKQKKETVVEICRFLFSLASVDGKILDDEVDCIEYLLSAFKIQNKYKEISKIVGKEYCPEVVPKEMQKIEIRHFTIWILFFFAYADETLDHLELRYIENCAESLKINKSNFLSIKEKFVKKDT